MSTHTVPALSSPITNSSPVTMTPTKAKRRAQSLNLSVRTTIQAPFLRPPTPPSPPIFFLPDPLTLQESPPSTTEKPEYRRSTGLSLDSIANQAPIPAIAGCKCDSCVLYYRNSGPVQRARNAVSTSLSGGGNVGMERRGSVLSLPSSPRDRENRPRMGISGTLNADGVTLGVGNKEGGPVLPDDFMGMREYLKRVGLSIGFAGRGTGVGAMAEDGLGKEAGEEDVTFVRWESEEKTRMRRLWDRLKKWKSRGLFGRKEGKTNGGGVVGWTCDDEFIDKSKARW